MQICPNCGEENPPRFRLCGFCGTPLAATLPPQEVRKTVTIVFSDLKGSTSLGESTDSEALREVLSAYFDRMRVELEAHGGLVEKYIGDAIMAVFGLPKLHEDDALRAVRAAAGMQRALVTLNEELERRWGVRLTNRTGVNTGEVVAGDTSTGQRLATGDAVNVAARLEQAAGEMEVLLGDLTYRLVRDEVDVDEVEPLELKGKAERVPAYRLVGVRDGAGPAREGSAPLVGRKTELRKFRRSLEDAADDRTAYMVTLIGEPGVGKTRLVEEFVRQAESEALVLRGRCLPYGNGITFWPLVEMVRQGAGIDQRETLEAAREKLTAFVAGGGDDVVQRVGSAVGLSQEQFPVAEIFFGVRRLVETLAAERPLVLLFEDIHWAEETLLDLIEHLTDVAEAPLLVACAARRELLDKRSGWGDQARSERIVLEPLSADESEEIVANLLGQAAVGDEIRSRIVEAAEGNPLFVEQLLSMLIDDGVLGLEEGVWVASQELPESAVPPTIQALLAARLDSLEREEKAVVEPASVIGYVFATDAVRELAPDPVKEEVTAHLGALSGKQLVEADRSAVDEERFRFHHILIRDTAYQALLKRTRATLHERFVQWADRVNEDRALEYEEILGYHLEQAFRYLSELGPLDDHGREVGSDASRRLASAGQRAFGRGDMPAAVNLLQRATDLLPEDDVKRLFLLPVLAEALLDVGEFGRAGEIAEEARDHALTTGNSRLHADATLVQLLLRRFADDGEGWSDEVLREAPRAIEVFEEYGDDAGLAKAWRLIAGVHGTAGRYGEAADASQRGREHARSAGDRRRELGNSASLAMAALFGPTPVERAVRECEDVLEQARGDRSTEGIALCAVAQLYAMRGEFDRARDAYRRAESSLDELGRKVLAASVSQDASEVEMLAGDPEAAERELRRGYHILEEVGERYLMSTVVALLAQAVYAQGRYSDADDLANLAEAMTTEDDVVSQALWRSIRAKLLARDGKADEAEAIGAEAVELLRTTDSLERQAQALEHLADARAIAGRLETAADALTEAIELYERKGNEVSAERARRALPAETSSA